MKKIFSFAFLSMISFFLHAQVSICSWNLFDFGKTKSNDEIEFIAGIVKDYDVVVIQEVVAKDAGGAQAVARLSEALNRKGAKWDYTISDATVSSSYKAERYAFIWKTGKLTISGKAWLEKKYNLEIDREPFFATFVSGSKEFTLANFHAVTKSKQPEKEIKYLKLLAGEYPGRNIIFCGDFNCPQTNTVFNPLKSMGYKPVLVNQKTSLKEVCAQGDCLASEFDNILFMPFKITIRQSGVIHFYKHFGSLKEARGISDHLPVIFQFSLN